MVCHNLSFSTSANLQKCKDRARTPVQTVASSPQSALDYTRRSRFSCSLALVVLSLLQLVVVVVPLGATLYVNNLYGYSTASVVNITHYHVPMGGERATQIYFRNQKALNTQWNDKNRIDRRRIRSLQLLHNAVVGEPMNYQSQPQLLIFAYIAVFSTRVTYFTTSEEGISRIMLKKDEQLTLNCQASISGIRNRTEVRWWKENEFFDSENITIVGDDSMGIYRCVADLPAFSMDRYRNFHEGGGRKGRRTEMPEGKVLSGAIVIEREKSIEFTTHPKSINVTVGSVVRLECVVEGSNIMPIVWYKGNHRIEQNMGKIRTYTIEHRSVLHVIGAQKNDSGYYACVCGNIQSQFAALNIAGEPGVNSANDLWLNVLPMEHLVALNKSVILECLVNDASASVSWSAVNDFGEPIPDQQFGDVSHAALAIHSVNLKHSGKYACVVTRDGIRQSNSTFITVQVPPLLLAETVVSRVTQTLGATARLKCSASVELRDSTFRIGWYKEGKNAVSLGRSKLQPSEGYTPEIVVNELGMSMVEFTKDLVISNVQHSDQGLYQCIVSNLAGERNILVGLVVESAAVDSPITNLNVVVDHENAQFILKWKLPEDMDILDVERSVFLLNYYLSKGGGSNNVPLHAPRCMTDRWCTAKCCSSNYIFYELQNYTFQMSLLKMDTVGKITPLSEPVTTVSWDGVARKALNLIILRASEETIQIAWQHPSIEIANGYVQKYVVEYYVDSGTKPDVRSGIIQSEQASFVLKNVIADSIYRIRVIPVTRHGYPSNALLKSNANYTFIGYVPDTAFTKLNDSIGPLIFTVEQLKHDGILAIKAEWGVSKSMSAGSLVQIRYSRVEYKQLREKAEETNHNDAFIILNWSFEMGRVYQFCSRVYVGQLHGPDFCQVYRMRTESFRDIFGDISTINRAPKAVHCEDVNERVSRECHCLSSYEFGDAMRVIWNWPHDDFSANEFVVHYTMNENDTMQDIRTLITDESFADLPNLLSNTTYRIMVEARNKFGGAEGKWFNCTTPELKPIPAPSMVGYKLINQTLIKISWNAVYADPSWSSPVGYVIQVQNSSTAPSISDVIVDGIDTTSHLLVLQPHTFYTFQVAARSSTGEIGQRSPPYFFATQNDIALNILEEGSRASKPFFTKKRKDVLLVSLVSIIGLLTIGFGAMCIFLRLKRRKLEMCLNTNLSQCGIKKACSINGNISMELEGLLNSSTVGTRHDDSSVEESAFTTHAASQVSCGNVTSVPSNNADSVDMDTKGGEIGALPSGRDKYLGLLNNKKQMELLKEAGLMGDLSCQPIVKKPESLKASYSDDFPKKKGNLILNSHAISSSTPAWGGSLPSKSRISKNSKMNWSARHSNGFRNMNMSRCLANSAENAMPVPRLLSTLVALSSGPPCITRQRISTHNQANSYSSILCTRSPSLRNSSCLKTRSECATVRRRGSNLMQSTHNTSCQSLVCGDFYTPANSRSQLANVVKSKIFYVAPSSSLPNLADSGIVYDELHLASNTIAN